MSDPYASARAHVALAAQNLPEEAAERLRWRLEANMVLNPQTGTVGFLDGSTSTAEWLRRLEKAEPDLLRKPAAETAAAVEPSKPATARMPDPWQHATKHITAKPDTVSAAMAAAKANPAARAALMKSLGLTK